MNKGEIRQKLQIILSTAQNSGKEIGTGNTIISYIGGGTVDVPTIIKDFRGIAEAVQGIETLLAEEEVPEVIKERKIEARTTPRGPAGFLTEEEGLELQEAYDRGEKARHIGDYFIPTSEDIEEYGKECTIENLQGLSPPQIEWLCGHTLEIAGGIVTRIQEEDWARHFREECLYLLDREGIR